MMPAIIPWDDCEDSHGLELGQDPTAKAHVLFDGHFTVHKLPLAEARLLKACIEEDDAVRDEVVTTSAHTSAAEPHLPKGWQRLPLLTFRYPEARWRREVTRFLEHVDVTLQRVIAGRAVRLKAARQFDADRGARGLGELAGTSGQTSWVRAKRHLEDESGLSRKEAHHPLQLGRRLIRVIRPAKETLQKSEWPDLHLDGMARDLSPFTEPSWMHSEPEPAILDVG
eukprot:CAMPEP_0119416802 /NCGR_PEP_ID=MMETSP1335-20130426/14171_1 /TAXON_ID=259385 /ORGANISM="Chrysoculter rhomboideus, Strain RCC1486" /LENGTH=225 /DNA_ID=CAMNT_0007441943 /DNA_START=96 /DNA_END=774 /DNA_ORIENTATION=-